MRVRIVRPAAAILGTPQRLASLVSGLVGRDSHSLCVEDKGFGFRFGALWRAFFAVPEEAHARGVADADYEFTRGVERGVGWGDESLLCDELSVGGDGDPGIFCGSDHNGQICRG